MDFIARELYLQTIEFRDLRSHAEVSAEVRLSIVDRWHDAVSPGSPPSGENEVLNMPVQRVLRAFLGSGRPTL